MDPELLVTRIEDGARLLHALARAGMSVTAAYWARRGADSSWHLHLAVPGYSSAAYPRLFGEILVQLSEGSEVKSPQLAITDEAADEAVLAIKLREQKSGSRPFHVGPKLLRPVGLYEAVIYPKVGKMSADEVGLVLAHEMNRTGDPHPVTLTLADGAEVRGYPLAIRKSAVGGAMVELADADTKGKGADVPLDRIFSVVPDSLTP